jgi:hypothetical protein
VLDKNVTQEFQRRRVSVTRACGAGGCPELSQQVGRLMLGLLAGARYHEQDPRKISE